MPCVYWTVIIFRWGTHLCMSVFPPVHSSVHHASYLRNCTSCDHNFWYTCVKWWYHEVFFFIFFFILIFWAVRGKRTKNSPKWKKNYFGHVPYPRNSITYYDFGCTFAKWYFQVFFKFFQNCYFSVFSEVKQQKMAQNDKKLSFMLHVSGTIYEMIVTYDTLV